jgi:hypothetical protein
MQQHQQVMAVMAKQVQELGKLANQQTWTQQQQLLHPQQQPQHGQRQPLTLHPQQQQPLQPLPQPWGLQQGQQPSAPSQWQQQLGQQPPAWGLQQQQQGLSQPAALTLQQQQQQGQQSPDWGAQKQGAWGRPQQKAGGPSAGGEPVVPAVVVFGEGSKTGLKKCLKGLSETAAAAVASLHKIPNGAPRYHLHCQQNNLPLVQSLVQLLNAAGVRAAIYTPQPALLPKSQQAAAGFAGAVAKAGICHYFEQGADCPHLIRNGRCNFTCWRGPPVVG